MNSRTLLFLLFCGLSTSTVFAQQGKISGVVVDKENGETLIGANVLVGGTGIGAITDLDGKFTLVSLPPASYTVIISYVGYHSVTVQNVEVLGDKVTTLNVSLSPEAIGLDEVVVEARALANTEGSLL